MRKIKRRVIINGVKHDIWLGLVKKGIKNTTVFNLYYYAGNPDDEDLKPVSLKNGFKGEKEAIDYGIAFMEGLLGNIIERNKN
jgi:hypothetical protein